MTPAEYDKALALYDTMRQRIDGVGHSVEVELLSALGNAIIEYEMQMPMVTWRAHP